MEEDLNDEPNTNYIPLNVTNTEMHTDNNKNITEDDSSYAATFYSVEYPDRVDCGENDIESLLLNRTSAELCRICFEDEGREMVELPCKHHICSICRDLIKNKECPFCRKYYGQPRSNNTVRRTASNRTTTTRNVASDPSCNVTKIVNTCILYACMIFLLYLFISNSR